MKRRFTDEQIIGVLKEHESGEAVAEICRELTKSPRLFATVATSLVP